MNNSSTVLILFTYLLSTIATSVRVNKINRSGGSFAIGKRQFGWLPAGISILATYISAMTFIGMPGWVYKGGMEAIIIHTNYPIVIFFTSVFFVPVFYKLGFTSIYEYLEQRFGSRLRTINALIFIFVRCIYSGIILYAVSLIVVQFLPISVIEAIIYISLFTSLYTYFGGITTVIWTDVIQSIVLLIGSVVVVYFLFAEMSALPIPIDLSDKLQAINLSLNPTADTTLWTGVFAASILHLSVYATNQLIIQRCLATRSVEHAQKAMLVCGYGAFFIYIFFSLIGIFLYIFYQGVDFENSNNIILDFVFSYTNQWVIGIVMAAVIAAAMSSLDSAYNSIATVATTDIYRRYLKKNADDIHYDKAARKLSLFCSIFVILPSILAISNESVLITLSSLVSVFVGIQLGSFVLGLCSKTANEKGALAGSLTSILSVAFLKVTGVAWPWFAPFGTAVFLFTGLAVSRHYGQLTEDNHTIIQNQGGLYTKPTTSQWLLLVYALLIIISCFYLPEIIPLILNK